MSAEHAMNYSSSAYWVGEKYQYLSICQTIYYTIYNILALILGGLVDDTTAFMMQIERLILCFVPVSIEAVCLESRCWVAK